MNRKVLGIVGIVLAMVVLVVLVYFAGIYFFLFRTTFVRSDYVPDAKDDLEYYATEENVAAHYADVEWFNSMSPELVDTVSFDGLKLVAWRLEHEDSKGTVLLMHGFHSDPLREYATLARFYYNEGYTVVLPYERAHGKSEGKYLTFGIKERYDCQTWINFINDCYGMEKDVFVQGISMGCATVVMSTGLELPFNVRGIIADCGFTSPYEITYWTINTKRHMLLGNSILSVGGMMTKLFADFDLNEYSTLNALNKNHIPILFITGTADETVPMEMTIQNFQACRAPKELLLVENSPHAINYYTDTANYERKLSKFMEKYGLYNSGQ